LKFVSFFTKRSYTADDSHLIVNWHVWLELKCKSAFTHCTACDERKKHSAPMDTVYSLQSEPVYTHLYILFSGLQI
jgi:hypothetical protein